MYRFVSLMSGKDNRKSTILKKYDANKLPKNTQTIKTFH